MTYGDGLCDADLEAELQFHTQHGRIGTVLGVQAPASRFGEMVLDADTVVDFAEKPQEGDAWINGGYFLFDRSFLNYLSTNEDCVLENDPLARLSKDGQLTMFRHRGFWACMDTQRDKDHLEGMWTSGNAPWMTKAGTKK